MAKKIFCRAVNILSVVVIVLALFVLLNVALTRSGEVPRVLGYSVFRVLTGSMEPAIGQGDMIVVKPADPASVAVGDVITFRTSDPDLQGAINTHRVTAVARQDGAYVFTTKGDANLVEDAYPVREGDLLGRVVFVSGFLGALSRLASNPLVFIPLILLPLLALLLLNLVRAVRLAKATAEEEERQALAQLVEQAKQRRAAPPQEQEQPQDGPPQDGPPQDGPPQDGPPQDGPPRP